MTVMRVAGAQVLNVVGDLEGNARRIADAMAWAEEQQADVLVLPELALTGYPLADLVLHRTFVEEAEDALQQLAGGAGRTTSIISTIDRVPPQRAWDTRERHVAIAAKLLCDGEVRGTYHKYMLPTYGIYDEGRNIAAGSRPNALWRIGDVIAGVAICEDIWARDGPPEAQSAAGARVLLVPNASPYHRGRGANRPELGRAVARRNGLPLVYVNFVGGQDDIVFDGGSLIFDGRGELLHRSPRFIEDRFCIDVPVAAPRAVTAPVSTVHTRPLPDEREPARPLSHSEPADRMSSVWHALLTGLRDFVRKNSFPGVVLGLSGGIDSAMTAAVAAAALGPEHVLGIAMPPEGEEGEELANARTVANNLGIDFTVIPLTPVEQSITRALNPCLGRRTTSETRRDMEAWARAAILSAFGDEHGLLILSTGNKSELSIGATTYGDLSGDFAPLRDCPKSLLYELARWRNRSGEAVPEAVLTRPTTAQTFEGPTMPPYHVLDPIVERYLQQQAEIDGLVADGFDPDVVQWVLRRVDDAEFLRRQTPIGIRVTATAFQQDRRMPISNAWRPHRSQ